MDEHGKLYWHEAFYEALQLELYEYRDALKFTYEHQLSKEALRMDVLVIKNDKNIKIKKNIGRIFKKCNIFEYKSESDSFSAWDYNKILGYACIYSSFEKIPISEITLSVSLTMHPRKLMKFLKNVRGLKVNEVGDGIYYVEGEIVPLQILESKRLSTKSNLFLKNLRSNLNPNEMIKTLQSYMNQKSFDEKNAYLDRLVRANPDILMEAMNMSEAAKKIILEGAEKYGWLESRYKKERKKAARETAKKMLKDGEAAEKIVRWTGLSVEEVAKLQ